MNYKNVCEQIWEIETNKNLFNKKIGGVYFWKIVRFFLVRRIAQEKGMFGQDHIDTNINFVSKVRYTVDILSRQRCTSAIFRKEKRNILVFDHPRKVNVNGEYIDIYTHDFISQLGEDQYEVVERSYLGKHQNKISKNRSYEEYISLISLIKDRMFGIKINKDELQYLAGLEKQINSLFDTAIDVKSFVISKINNFNWRKNYYDKLLKIRQPSIVYMVVSYVYEPLIAACLENHIETIEFQHGTMSKYHLGYSFPEKEAIPYFPDKMILFGKYWYDSTPLPISEDNVSYHGFPYLRNNLLKYKSRSKEKNTVLFISQGTIGRELSKIALKLARGRNDYKITYKLHPGEFGRWRVEYPDLLKAEQLDNFTVLETADLHELQAISEYQIGVYSTAIFEGLMINCKTILMKLSGIEYMEFLIENEYVRLAADGDDLLSLIGRSLHEAELDKAYFFSDIQEQKIG